MLPDLETATNTPFEPKKRSYGLPVKKSLKLLIDLIFINIERVSKEL